MTFRHCPYSGKIWTRKLVPTEKNILPGPAHLISQNSPRQHSSQQNCSLVSTYSCRRATSSWAMKLETACCALLPCGSDGLCAPVEESPAWEQPSGGKKGTPVWLRDQVSKHPILNPGSVLVMGVQRWREKFCCPAFVCVCVGSSEISFIFFNWNVTASDRFWQTSLQSQAS